MDKETLEIFCKIAAKLAEAKSVLAISRVDRETYTKIRNLLGDCQELMAIKADVAPIRLISGNV